MKYYHMSKEENIESILMNGLKGFKNTIFLVTHPFACNIIARQFRLDNFGLLEIDDAGILTEIRVNDNVDSPFLQREQRKILQDIIKPEYIQLLGLVKTDWEHKYRL